MRLMLEIIGDTLIIAFGMSLLYQFITIGIVGWYGFEPNKAILYAEIAMSVLILALGINRFVNDIHK